MHTVPQYRYKHKQKSAQPKTENVHPHSKIIIVSRCRVTGVRSVIMGIMLIMRASVVLCPGIVYSLPVGIVMPGIILRITNVCRLLTVPNMLAICV